MHVLVVESNEALAHIWSNHLEREGCATSIATDHTSAVEALRFTHFDVLVMDLMLPNASVLAISDYAAYRNPDVAIIVVTASSFFSDGSIFDIMPNARGYLHTPVHPEDLAAMVDHYGRPPTNAATKAK